MKDFVPYEQALELDELGFDEPCLAHLIGFGDGTIENGRYKTNQQQVFYPDDYVTSDDKAEELGLHPFVLCGVPTFSQAFRFFRERHGVYMHPSRFDETKWWVCWGSYTSHICDSFEEAELACLRKLISLAQASQ
jgi:hypothetical protein